MKALRVAEFILTCAAFLALYVFAGLPITAHAQVLGPARGGTGTSTLPTYGKILVGQTNGTYAPAATSSLGLASLASFSASYPLLYSGSTGVFSTDLSTTTANSWSALQQFNANASTTQLTVTGNTYLATAGGNVSIGGTVASARLDVVGDGSNYALELNNTSTGDGLQINTAASTLNNGILWKEGSNTVFNVYSDGSNRGRAALYDTNAVSILLQAGGDSYFAGSGKFGIATTTPTSQLFIKQTDSTNASGVGIGAAGASTVQYNLFTDSNLNFHITKNGATTDGIALTQAYNVGIGSSTPWGKLSVNPSGITGPAFVVGSSTATSFIVSNGGTVGIGTTTPSSRLTVWENSQGNIANFVNVSSTTVLAITNGGATTTNMTVSGRLYLADGSATAPSLAFDTQNNMGFWKTATNQIAVSIGGQIKAKINQNGYEVTSDEGFVIRSASNGGQGAADTYLLRDAAGVFAIKNGGNPNALNIYGTTTNSSNYERLSFQASTTYNAIVLDAAGYGTARPLGITGANVGIGTTNPAQLLDVQGTAEANNFVLDTTASNTGLFAGASARLQLRRGNTPFLQGDGTQVGIIGTYGLGWYAGSINTGDPDTELWRDAAGILALRRGSSAQEFRIYNTDATDDEFASLGFQNATNVFTLQTEATGAGLVRPIAFLGGNVGVGTTSPSSQFTVASTSAATTTIEVGDQFSSSSHACFNTKNTAGSNISFYFVGTAMVVENNRCR